MNLTLSNNVEGPEESATIASNSNRIGNNLDITSPIVFEPPMNEGDPTSLTMAGMTTRIEGNKNFKNGKTFEGHPQSDIETSKEFKTPIRSSAYEFPILPNVEMDAMQSQEEFTIGMDCGNVVHGDMEHGKKLMESS